MSRNRRTRKRSSESKVDEDGDVEMSQNENKKLKMKADHANRPLWVCQDGHIYLETFAPYYKQAYDFLIAIAEPVSRPTLIHEYQITKHSLYGASSVGLQAKEMITALNRFSKNELPSRVQQFISREAEKCGKVRLVLKNERQFVESTDDTILEALQDIQAIWDARIDTQDMPKERGFIVGKRGGEKVNFFAFLRVSPFFSILGVEKEKKQTPVRR